MMNFNWKIALLIVVVAVIAVIAIYQFGIKTSQPTTITPPAATGNISDTIDALIKDAVNEQSTLVEEESDTDLINADSQAISDFGQSYNENEI